mgnify:CR=1 FL=1
MNACMHRLFLQLDPVGQKMRFHLRAGTSFTGTVHAVHHDEDGRIAVIQLVPGHKSTGDFMFLDVNDICAIAYAESASQASRPREKLEVVTG